MSVETVMPSNHLILCCPILLPPSNFPSIKIFSNESVLCIRGPKYWFQLQHQSFQWIFRTDFLSDELVWSPYGQGTLESLLQQHSSKVSILPHSAFFTVQLSHPYMTTRKIALTRQNFVSKAMSLLFNMLSRLVIMFLPRKECLLISWLQSPSAVILEPQKRVCHCFHCFPIYFPWSDGTGCHA